MTDKDKSSRGNASQFFVAGELCRRGHSAVVTMGNTPNTDILCSNKGGTSFAHIQVKTFVPGSRTCSVGLKAEKVYGDRFFWVLGGIPQPGSSTPFEYYILPASVMAAHVTGAHRRWLKALGAKGQPHRDSAVRTVHLPPYRSQYDDLDVGQFRDRWDLIEHVLDAKP